MAWCCQKRIWCHGYTSYFHPSWRWSYTLMPPFCMCTKGKWRQLQHCRFVTSQQTDHSVYTQRHWMSPLCRHQHYSLQPQTTHSITNWCQLNDIEYALLQQHGVKWRLIQCDLKFLGDTEKHATVMQVSTISSRLTQLRAGIGPQASNTHAKCLHSRYLLHSDIKANIML